MADDPIQLYCRSIGFEPARRTVLAEGTSDAALFRLARDLELKRSSIDLYGSDFTIAAAGIANDGGTTGVLRELSRLKGYSRIVLAADGKQKYRFIGLVDNDAAGKHAARTSNALNTDILEYRDIFRLRPVMPETTNYDLQAVRSLFESANVNYNTLDWEAEDLLLSSFVAAFLQDHPSALRLKSAIEQVEHREWTNDGKILLHRYISQNAMYEDICGAIGVIRSLRSLVGLTSV